MALRYFANSPATTLAASCSSGATSISVSSVSGLPIQYPYTLILDRGTASEEVVTVTAGASTTLTVVRGADNTTAFSHSVGAGVEHGISAQDPREANAHVNATSGVHGVTGALVGVTDAQTLSNKTLITPTIASMVNATHNHTGSAGGGQLTDAALSTAVSVAKGGTGASALTAGNFLQGNGTSPVTAAKAVPAGVVVGTTDIQTLTNKTLASPAISSPTITTPVITGGMATGVAIDATSVIGSGTSLGAWTAYTPALYNVTLGTGGTVTAAYVRIGNTVIGRVVISLGTGGALTGLGGFALPAAPLITTDAIPLGTATLFDNPGAALAGIVRWSMSASVNGGSGAVIVSVNNSTATNIINATATSPWTWNATDRIAAEFTYEAAS
jgi:hypothetical protein